MHVGAFDAIVIAALAAGFVLGRSKGFAWQVSGIATLVLGYLVAALGSAGASRLFPASWPDDLRRYAAWVGLYGLVSLSVYLVTLKLSKKIKEKELDGLDRSWGSALGAFKAALLVTVGTLVAIAASERARDVVRESATGPYLVRGALVARPILPERIGAALADCASRFLSEPIDAAPQPPPPAPAPTPPTPPPTRPGHRPGRPSRPSRTSRKMPRVQPTVPVPPGPALDQPAADEPMTEPVAPADPVAPAEPEEPAEPDPFDVPATEPVDPLAPPR